MLPMSLPAPRVRRALSAFLAGEVKLLQDFQLAVLNRVRFINQERVSLGLAGPVAVDALGVQPAFFLRLLAHPYQPLVKLRLQLLPFLAVGVLCTPGEPVQLVD